MKKDMFRDFISDKMTFRPIIDTISRCKRVEKYYGDLDIHYSNDKCQSLLDSDLEKIDFNGDRYTGVASLKSAIRRYCDFCEYNSKLINKKKKTIYHKYNTLKKYK